MYKDDSFSRQSRDDSYGMIIRARELLADAHRKQTRARDRSFQEVRSAAETPQVQSGPSPAACDSWYVTRPVFGGVGSHTFVAVGDRLGGKLDQIYSGGPSANGRLVDLAGSGAPTATDDLAAFHLAGNPEAAARAGITVRRINAPDEAVVRAGGQMRRLVGDAQNPGNVTYWAVPELGPVGVEANSNSYAAAIGHMAQNGNQPDPGGLRNPPQRPAGRLPGFNQYGRLERLMVPNGQDYLRTPTEVFP